MRRILRLVAYTSGVLGALALGPRLEGRPGGAAWLPRLWAQAWAPLVAIAGGIAGGASLASGHRRAAFAGTVGAIAAARYTRLVAAPHDAFAEAFGQGWESRIPTKLRSRNQQRRWRLVQPAPPAARVSANIVVGVRRNDGKPLLADVWRPPGGVSPSSLGVVFLHGGLWQALDKDFLSRPLMRRLAGVGHVVADLAYPLAPAARLDDMVDAVHQTVWWMRAHAGEIGARPDRLVLVGSAGGGHLALLVGYTDPSIRGVVSVSGIADPVTFFDEYGRSNPAQPRSSADVPGEMRARDRDATALDRFLTRRRVFPRHRYGNMPGGPLLLLDLFGGTPAEAPEAYRRGSPLTHAGPASPPTLQVSGADDFVVPPAQARRLHRVLRESGVPSVLVELPRTVHGFDQYVGVSRRVAPAAQAATQDLEQFLGLMAGEDATLRRATPAAVAPPRGGLLPSDADRCRAT